MCSKGMYHREPVTGQPSRAYDFPEDLEARQAWKEPADPWGLGEGVAEAVDDVPDELGHIRKPRDAEAVRLEPDPR